MKKVLGRLIGGPGQLPNEPFATLLANALATELELAEILPVLLSEAVDPELRRRLSEHVTETTKHIANVERMFRAFDAQPAPSERNPALEGLKEVHRMLAERTDGELKDIEIAAAVAATEHLEISLYEALRTMADAIDQREVVALIDETLDQERRALDAAAMAMHKLSASHARDMGSS